MNVRPSLGLPCELLPGLGFSMSSPQTCANASSCLCTDGIVDHSLPSVASVLATSAARRLAGESSV